jgi:hypothetical protein
VYHSLETGSGYEGLVTFCSIMNMPCLSLPSYYKMVDMILVAVEAEAHEEMQLAGQSVGKKCRQAIKQRKVMREEALWEAEGVTYEAGGF